MSHAISFSAPLDLPIEKGTISTATRRKQREASRELTPTGNRKSKAVNRVVQDPDAFESPATIKQRPCSPVTVVAKIVSKVVPSILSESVGKRLRQKNADLPALLLRMTPVDNRPILSHRRDKIAVHRNLKLSSESQRAVGHHHHVHSGQLNKPCGNGRTAVQTHRNMNLGCIALWGTSCSRLTGICPNHVDPLTTTNRPAIIALVNPGLRPTLMFECQITKFAEPDRTFRFVAVMPISTGGNPRFSPLHMGNMPSKTPPTGRMPNLQPSNAQIKLPFWLARFSQLAVLEEFL